MEMEKTVQIPAQEAQAKHIAGLLDDHANHLSLRTLTQLENARERALQAHAQQAGVLVHNNGSISNGTLSHLFGWTEQHRITSAALLAGAILLGFLSMQVLKPAEPSDAFLLGADLPPEAFVDRGFEPSLNAKQAKI